MHQSGIENVVASSGTSLTKEQVRLIHRFTENVTVLYDGDAAGIHASLRGIDMLLSEGLNIKILLLPEGEDRADGESLRPAIRIYAGRAARRALRHFGLPADTKRVVVVIGGSLGALSINESIGSRLEEWAKSGVALIWQTGKGSKLRR